MPKAAVLVALALMLLTGLVIGSLNSLATPEPALNPLTPTSDATSRTAVAFYDAVDWLLESGDASPLRQVVHPGFADHSLLSDEPGTRDSFETWLQSIRQNSPEVRFTVSEVVAQSDLIAVELEQAGALVPSLAGLPLSYPSSSSGYELLRIEHELVIERWASRALPGAIEPSAARLDGMEPADWIREPRIERFEFDAAGSLDVPSHKGTVLIAESGSLNLRIVTPGVSLHSDAQREAIPSSASHRVPERLEPGSIRSIEPDTKFRIWNSSQREAAIIAISVFQFEPADYNSTADYDQIVEGSVTRQLLAGGATIRPDHGPFQLLVGHAVAVPGTSIASHKVNELELLFVTSGSVEASVHKGFAFSLTEFSGLKTESDVATVGPDEAISASFG
ncbi:hypothetical protein BH24CHL4_BH24CHL4_13170 [soil metagenome]